METARPRVRAGNLTAALLVVALLELWLNRLAGRLFFPRATLSLGGGSRAGSFLAASGPFLFQLTAVLGLVVLVASFAGLLRRGELYPRGMRFSVGVMAAVFAIFSAQALLRGQLVPRYFLYLETSFGFLSLLTAIAFAVSRTLPRVRVGVALLSLPGLLHAAAILGMGWGQGSDSATLIAGVGEAALIAAGVGAPFLLPPRPRRERHWRLPLVVATTLSALFVVALSTRFDLVQASALYGLRMELPPLGSIAGLAYVLALFGWSYATVELITDKAGMRLCGYGLGLLALGGYDAGSPVELTLSLLGLVAVAVGELRAFGRIKQDCVDALGPNLHVGEAALGEAGLEVRRADEAGRGGLMETADDGVAEDKREWHAGPQIFGKLGVVRCGEGQLFPHAIIADDPAKWALSGDVDGIGIERLEPADHRTTGGEREADLAVAGHRHGTVVGRGDEVDFDAGGAQLLGGLVDRADDAVHLGIPGVRDNQQRAQLRRHVPSDPPNATPAPAISARLLSRRRGQLGCRRCRRRL